MSDVFLQLSAFQQRVCDIPEQFDVFLGGGRGGAKSYTLAILALRHAEQYGQRARILYLRQSHQGTTDFEGICLDLFGRVFGRDWRYNSQSGIGRFPNGATLEINQLADPSCYQKFQGRSYSLLLVDEAGQYASPDLLDKMRSNLRGPRDMPTRMVIAANPADLGHVWLAARYVFKTAPWKVFDEPKSQRQWVYAPSLFTDNPHIDQTEYRKQLESSCPSDPELLRAWLLGDWTVARGAYFGACLEESRNAVERWDGIPANWSDAFLAHDFGSSAPSVTYIVAQSPGGYGPDKKFYPRDSLILADELATNEPGSLSKGMGWTVPILSDAIKEMCDRWKPNGRPQFQKVPLKGVADDACFAAAGHSRGSIADEFRRLGISYTPARKADRLSGWTTLKRLLADAGKPDVPGLYIARHCEYFWQTVPYLGRDPRRVEDVDSRQADHAADAARYACLRLRRSITQSDLWGRDASIARKPSDYRTVIREFEEKAGIDLSPNSFTTAERQRFEQSPPPSRKSDKA